MLTEPSSTFSPCKHVPMKIKTTTAFLNISLPRNMLTEKRKKKNHKVLRLWHITFFSWGHALHLCTVHDQESRYSPSYSSSTAVCFGRHTRTEHNVPATAWLTGQWKCSMEGNVTLPAFQLAVLTDDLTKTGWGSFFTEPALSAATVQQFRTNILFF